MSIYFIIFQIIVSVQLIVLSISTIEYIVYLITRNNEAIRRLRENGHIGQSTAAMAIIGTGLYCIIDLLTKIEQK